MRPPRPLIAPNTADHWRRYLRRQANVQRVLVLGLALVSGFLGWVLHAAMVEKAGYEPGESTSK